MYDTLDFNRFWVHKYKVNIYWQNKETDRVQKYKKNLIEIKCHMFTSHPHGEK